MSPGDHKPSARATAWRRLRIGLVGLLAIAAGCGAAASLAGASSTTLGWKFVNSQAPGSSSDPVQSLYCSSAALCFGSGGTGTWWVSTDPSGSGSSAWTDSALSGATESYGINSIRDVSCPSTSLCVTLENSSALYTTDPAGGGSTWHTTALAHSIGKTADMRLSCTTTPTDLCLASYDNGADLLSTTDPAGGSWSVSTPPTDANEVSAISCPTSSLCVMLGATTGGEAVVWTTTDPANATPTWAETEIDNGNYNADATLTCPSGSFCLIGDPYGNVITSTNPSADSWNQPVLLDPDNEYPIGPISCASAQFCVVFSQGLGSFLSSTDPTGGVSAWSTDPISGTPPTGFTGINVLSCPTSSTCFAGDGDGTLLEGSPGGGSTTTTTSTTSTHSSGPPSHKHKPSGTKISSAKIKGTKATFKFSAKNATGYQCSLVAAPKKGHPAPKPKFKSCHSPKAYSGLHKGKYTFAVRGQDSAGVDPKPASKGFTIK